MATRYAQSRTVHTELIVHVPYAGKDKRTVGGWKAEGGNLEGDDIRYGEFPVATGNFSRSDMTLRRPYDQDALELEKWLEANRGAAVSIVRYYHGDDRQPLGDQVKTLTGRIRGVDQPDGDFTASERVELAVTCVMDVVAA